jgi:hypothetical protein
MNVVLPAPFGPRSPVIPCPMSTVSWSRATVAPNRFVSPRASTIEPSSIPASNTSAGGLGIAGSSSHAGDAEEPGTLGGRRPWRREPGTASSFRYMRSIMARPKAEQEISFAPSMRRAKS